jgi:opacity protein-like surface antigen
MRVLIKGAAAFALGMLLTAPAARAQGAEFSLGGGLSIPTGDFDDAAKVGWQGMAGVSFVPQEFPVGIQVDGAFSQFNDETPADIKDQVIYGTGNIVYRFKSSEETTFRPYLIAGGGVYNLKIKGDDVPTGFDDSQTKFGINAGAGFDFKAGAAGLFVEARFHDVFTDGPNIQFIPINVGVRLGGAFPPFRAPARGLPVRGLAATRHIFGHDGTHVRGSPPLAASLRLR